MNQADDRIFWAPVGEDVVLLPYPAHPCPTATIVHLTIRECLDPMALGLCRYCQQPLPDAKAES